MKSSTIPSIRVEPELRREVEDLLGAGESLSEFVEKSVRDSVRRRRTQAEFIARGMASLADAKRTGVYVDADVTMQKLDEMLARARALTQEHVTATARKKPAKKAAPRT